MPRYTVSPATIADYAADAEIENIEADMSDSERTPNGNFSYYAPASGRFAPDKLAGRARRAYDELRALGVDSLFINYNGGFDEGFAQLQNARGNGIDFSVEELIERFKTGPLGEKTEQKDEGALSVWHPDESQVTRAQWAEEAIWDLVETCANELLGQSYGVGECSIYGRCLVNLVSGEITDDPTKVEDLPADADEKYGAESADNYDGD